MLLSIIIPLYNLEGYIEGCIRSTLVQDLAAEEYEVLVIDDGSSDGSLRRAQAAAQGHPNVHVLTKPNQGLSLTRNYGTDRAQGRYVLYLDADDSLQPNVLGMIVRTMDDEELDMLAFDLQGVNPQGNPIPLWTDGIMAQNSTEVQTGKEFLRNRKFLPMVYLYAYRREFLSRNLLQMKPIWHEDEEFTPRALYLARRIRFIPLMVYNYLQRSDSYMNSYRPENLRDLVAAMKSLRDFSLRIEPLDPDGAEIFKQIIAKGVFHACRFSAKNDRDDTLKLIRLCRQEGLLPIANPTGKFKYGLLNHTPHTFLLYYKLHRK